MLKGCPTVTVATPFSFLLFCTALSHELSFLTSFLHNVKSCHRTVINLHLKSNVQPKTKAMFAILVFIGMVANVIGTLLGGNDNWSR